MPRTKLGLIGLLVAAASVGLARVEGSGEFGALTVVGGVILASALLAEATGVVAAIYEILLGFIVGLAGAVGSHIIDVIALVGGSLLMFAAGLEIDTRIMSRYLVRSMAVGLTSFLAPMASTFTVLHYAMGYPVGDSLLASVGVSTTSVAVVYSIARRHGVLSSWRGQILLASAMATDVFSILAFTLMVLDPSPLLAIYVAALLAVPPIASRLLDRLPPTAYEAEVRVIIAMVMAVTLFSEAVGVHGVLFSFLLGAALSGARVKRRVEERLGPLIFGFMAPVFFVNAGLHIAPVGLSRLKTVVSVLLLSSYPAKLLATGLALRAAAGIRGWRLPNVMAARLTVSTIIAYAGLKGGLMDPQLAAGVMASALLATLLSTLGGGPVEG
ncbi:MAG: cation:proton antiporter [Desulfurococcales archaeon]|nr:cation:proton antiporter [Desulfurococcales archaeon]